MNRGYLTSIAFLVFAVPLLVSAQVVITEIMYDPSGADAGHEWIELYNPGASVVSLTKWKLRVNGASHKISKVSGGDTLAPQAHARITQDAATFIADNATFDGMIFHSSFSLSNTSGMISIIDASNTVVTTKSYKAAPIVKTPKPVHTKSVKKSHASKKFASNSPYTAGVPDDVHVGTGSLDPQVEVAAAAHASPGNASLWWLGVTALTVVAGIATFASRRVAKREWSIEEDA